MKIRRFACSAFSLCVLMTSTLFANAANIPEDNRISEYAGETIQCQIVKCTDNNTPESSVISVTIPEGATKAQEDQIIQAAAFNKTSDTDTYAARNVMDLISRETDVSVNSNGYTFVGSGTIPGPDHITLVVQFGNYANFGAKKMSVVVSGGKNPDRSHTITTDISPMPSTTITLVMYTGMGNVFLTDGSTVTATAKTDASHVDADYCEIWVSPWEMSGG